LSIYSILDLANKAQQLAAREPYAIASGPVSHALGYIMKRLESRYILSAILISIGFFLWLILPGLNPLGNFFIIFSTLFWNKVEWGKPIKFKIPKWNSEKFFNSLSLFLCLSLIISLVFQIEDKKFQEFFDKWYLVCILWFLSLSLLSSRYINEKKKAQQKNARDRAGACSY